MKNNYTPFKVERRELAMEDGLFRPKPGSWAGLVECVECGGNGHPGGTWMDKHIAGHTDCPECGERTPTSSLKQHQRHHGPPKG